jgi:hypothetical protein
MSSVTAAVPGRYRLLFRAYGVRGVLGWSIVARFPLGMIPLGLVLLVRDAGGSYGTAGLVVAAYSIASAIGAPVAGRLVDRRGQAWVLLPRAALYPAALAAVCVLALADAPTWTLAMAAAVAAALVPPIAACVRTLWPRLLRTADLRATAYSLDAALQEVFFTLGPLLVAAIAATASPSAALLTAAALGGLGTLAFVLRTPSREWRPDGDARGHGSWLGPLTAPGVRVLVAMTACYGAAFGAVEGAAGEGDGEPAPVVRSDTPSRAFASSRRGSPEVAAVRPSRTVRTVFRTVSLPPSSSVDTCSSTRSTTPGRMRSTSSVGVGLSESGASEVRSETTTTAAATTPTPADAYPRPVRPRRESPRRERKFGRGVAGAFAPRPSLRIRLRTSFVTAGPPSS